MTEELKLDAKSIYAALAAVQADCEAPKKNAANPHFKSKFADLAQVLECLHKPLAEHGLAVLQTPVTVQGAAGVHTRILHISGTEIDCGQILMPLGQASAQAVGSAITYARRYSLMAIFRLAAEDDDGESAEGRGSNSKAKAAPVRKTMDDVVAGFNEETGEDNRKRDEYGIAIPTLACPKLGANTKYPGKLYTEAPEGYIEANFTKYGEEMSTPQREWSIYVIERRAARKAAEGTVEP